MTMAPPVLEQPAMMQSPATARAWPFRKKPRTDDGSKPPPPRGPEDHVSFGKRAEVCDRCVQDAVYEVVINEDLQFSLFFCAHHFRKHFAELAQYAWHAL